MPSDPAQNADDLLLELADRFISGQATAEEMAQLESLLAGSPQARRDYLLYALVHAQLPVTLPVERSPVGFAGDAGDVLPGDLPKDVETGETGHMRGPDATVALVDRKDRRSGWSSEAILRGTVVLAVLALLSLALLAVGKWRERGNSPLPHAPTASAEWWGTDASPYDNRELPIQRVAWLPAADAGFDPPPAIPSRARSISPTTLTGQDAATRFESLSGANILLSSGATFGVDARAGGILYEGSVRARSEHPETSYAVLTSNLRIAAQGGEFQVTLVNDRQMALEVMEGEVVVESRTRVPLYYWNFDDLPAATLETEQPEPPKADLQLPDKVGDLGLTLGKQTRRVAGLIGNGALAFDNTPDAFAQIAGGTGQEVGAGGMACSSGISIEALFVSDWTGKFRDYDEIFRKEDGVYRVLLSFQNDGELFGYDLPAVPGGPCLSFGLHLEKHGYSELDMPLDGRDGRPTVAELTDGKPHHVVASYDSFSGRKAIFIDGRLCFEHQFPVGALILNGGPAVAEIGNQRQREPFRGVIDEVAFYDFALNQEEIETHYRHAVAGENYFRSLGDALRAPRWQTKARYQQGTSVLLQRTTGEPSPASGS